MRDSGRYHRKLNLLFLYVLIGTLILPAASRGFAQQIGELEGRALYDALKAFELQSKAAVSDLKLKRDLGEITFTGDFYFSAPVNGRVTGAVFIGQGTFRTEVIESDFKTAILRFTDDTYDIVGKDSAPAAAIPNQASDLAGELEPRLLKETGANISARLAISIANHESPGFFFAQFDKGTLDRFTFVIDPQCRIPNYTFGYDGGEKVTVFRYDSKYYGNNLWIATYMEEDFANNRVGYSSDFDVVDPKHYEMEIDLRKARNKLRTKIRIDLVSLVDNLRAIPMVINDDITSFDNERLEDSMRVESARYNGQDIPCIQEEWESGLTFLLPKPMKKGEEFSIEVSMEGDFLDDYPRNVFYPQGNANWYPRHGFNKRSTFDLIFRHDKAELVSSVGSLVRKEKWPDGGSSQLTEYKIDTPIPFVSFVAGILKRHSKIRQLESAETEISFYSLPVSTNLQSINEKFILTEMGNALEYFSKCFGPYPYNESRAAYRPRNSGQAFANLVTLPSGIDIPERHSFHDIGGTISRQWWGNVISGRSYRDQWLSEGLVEYSGLLYVLERMQNIEQQKELLHNVRYYLRRPPITDVGFGEGTVAEIGPLVLGRRLGTLKSMNSYRMISCKGALVVRMLHYLFSNPSTGEDSAFFEMLEDFTNQYAFKNVNTEDFRQIANKHFPRTAIAKRFGLKNLNWFFRQWLYEANLPSYRMEYSIESDKGGRAVLAGKIMQENVPKHWFMPLPLIIKFPGNQQTRTMVWAVGPETEIEIPPLPMKPDSVELDPDWWILSEKTQTKKK